MALRLSIGATRRRLVRSCSSLELPSRTHRNNGWRAVRVVGRPICRSLLAPPQQLLRLILEVDWRTVLTAATLTMAMTMLFGLAPALRGSATPLVDALRKCVDKRRSGV